MTPEEFAAKIRAARGITLTGTPITPIPDPATRSFAVPPVIPPAAPDESIRTDVIRAPGGPATDPAAPPVNLYPHGRPPLVPPVDISPAAVTAPSPSVARAAPPPARVFPVEGTDPVPTAPPGVSLTSTPAQNPALGWAGTVGLPGTPEEAKAFDKGGDYQKMLAGMDDIAKGMRPKAPVANPFPVMTAEQPNNPNQMAGQLMAALMQNKRGLTLTGR